MFDNPRAQKYLNESLDRVRLNELGPQYEPGEDPTTSPVSAGWKEEEHPRDEDGQFSVKFTPKKETPKLAAEPVEEPPKQEPPKTQLPPQMNSPEWVSWAAADMVRDATSSRKKAQDDNQPTDDLTEFHVPYLISRYGLSTIQAQNIGHLLKHAHLMQKAKAHSAEWALQKMLKNPGADPETIKFLAIADAVVHDLDTLKELVMDPSIKKDDKTDIINMALGYQENRPDDKEVVDAYRLKTALQTVLQGKDAMPTPEEDPSNQWKAVKPEPEDRATAKKNAHKDFADEGKEKLAKAFKLLERPPFKKFLSERYDLNGPRGYLSEIHRKVIKSWTSDSNAVNGAVGKILAGKATDDEKNKFADDYGMDKEKMEEFIFDYYASTQEWLKEHGREKVTSYRGVYGDLAVDMAKALQGGKKRLKLKTRSISSFSVGQEHAHYFMSSQDDGFVVKLDVPRQAVFGLYEADPTGFENHYDEKEVVYLSPEEATPIKPEDIVEAYSHGGDGKWDPETKTWSGASYSAEKKLKKVNEPLTSLTHDQSAEAGSIYTKVSFYYKDIETLMAKAGVDKSTAQKLIKVFKDSVSNDDGSSEMLKKAQLDIFNVMHTVGKTSSSQAPKVKNTGSHSLISDISHLTKNKKSLSAAVADWASHQGMDQKDTSNILYRIASWAMAKAKKVNLPGDKWGPDDPLDKAFEYLDPDDDLEMEINSYITKIYGDPQMAEAAEPEKDDDEEVVFDLDKDQEQANWLNAKKKGEDDKQKQAQKEALRMLDRIKPTVED